MNRVELSQFIVKCQKRLRTSGLDPTWDNYLKQGSARGKEPTCHEEFERLWRIIHDACPDPVDHQRKLEYLLVYLVSLDDPRLHPNPDAFSLTQAEATAIHAIVQKYS